MGLLDTIMSQLTGKSPAGDTLQGKLVQAVLSMLSNPSGEVGGLGGLINRFQSAGLGSLIQSWISSGTNKPISAEQVSTGFGAEAMTSLANSTGTTTQHVAGELATLLPSLIDKLTPRGTLPDNATMLGSAASLVSSLFQQKQG